MQETKVIITIAGFDKVGIVAKFTTALSDYRVNIEDIKQTIMQDYFVMVLLVDTAPSEHSFKEIKEKLLEVGKELEMEVWVQKKQIFDKMHTI